MFKVYCSHNINQIPQLKHNNIIKWNKLAWNIHDKWPPLPNFTDLVHLLAECQYSFSALITMLFIPSYPRQSNGVASPRQRYTIKSDITTSTAGICQHTSLLPLFAVHWRMLNSLNNLPSTYGNRIYQTEYIKYIFQNTNFLFEFSSCNVIPISDVLHPKHPVLLS